ncbi:MAG: hypothetical protein EPN26_02960 [Rhodospirillales bacterium]|nr:MAG: hypothetical protein EPN26_02960 [Rhodospirillales bacterium]
MELKSIDGERPLSLVGLIVSWFLMAMVAAPLWIWMDGRYGILKALFFSVFFALTYRVKRNSLDVAVFTLIMTGLQVFSRQAVNYHMLAFDAVTSELLVLAAHGTLTLFAAWLMSWLFDLRNTPGPTYTRLAALYMTFYLGQYVIHALSVMLWRGYAFTFAHLLHYALMLSIPLFLWWAGTKAVTIAGKHLPPFRADATWKHRFKDFENTRAVVLSCLALFAVSIVWFGFVHFVIGKLGVTQHYALGSTCAGIPGLGDYMLHALTASFGFDGGCLASNSFLSRAVDYVEIVVSLFLALVLVQALALAFSAQPADPPPGQRK